MNNITDKDLKQVAEYVVALEEPFVAVTSINVAGGFDYDHFSGTKFEYKLEKTEDMTYHFSGTTEEQQLYDNGIKQAYILNEARRRYWSTVQKYVEGLYELYGK
ncbi:MAG: hypothetical protein LBG52_01420 [Candidatus Peribacteria bacterium]|nr:hypothetical protein [Candidatus Peribacteria bacterium]